MEANEEMMQHELRSGESDDDETEAEDSVDERVQGLHAEMERLEKLDDTNAASKQGCAGVFEDDVDNQQALRKYALQKLVLELSRDQTDPNRLELCQRAFSEHQMHVMDDVGITDAGFNTNSGDRHARKEVEQMQVRGL